MFWPWRPPPSPMRACHIPTWFVRTLASVSPTASLWASPRGYYWSKVSWFASPADTSVWTYLHAHFHPLARHPALLRRRPVHPTAVEVHGPRHALRCVLHRLAAEQPRHLHYRLILARHLQLVCHLVLAAPVVLDARRHNLGANTTPPPPGRRQRTRRVNADTLTRRRSQQPQAEGKSHGEGENMRGREAHLR